LQSINAFAAVGNQRLLSTLRILIDCTGITLQKAGVGVYAKNLVEQLIALPDGPHYFILVQDDDPDWDLGDRANLTILKVRAKLFRKLPLRFLLEQIGLPFMLMRHGIDALHSLHYSFPLMRFGRKQLVTIHDMTFISMPEMHERLKVHYFGFFIRASARLADRLIFVSHSAKRDYINRLGIPRASAVVIHHGRSTAYHERLDRAEIQRVREKYGLGADFILYIGTIEPRKNLPRLVAAFAFIAKRHPELSLVIAGMKGWMYGDLMETIQRSKLESRVVFTGFVPEDEKPFLIAGARAFGYPSLYEGFGIPVLEAMSCGIPTVTSNVSSLPEVAGDAALTVDPTDVNAIALALERVVSDEALRDRLKCASLIQASRFDWSITASMTREAYAGLFQHSQPPRT